MLLSLQASIVRPVEVLVLKGRLFTTETSEADAKIGEQR